MRKIVGYEIVNGYEKKAIFETIDMDSEETKALKKEHAKKVREHYKKLKETIDN